MGELLGVICHRQPGTPAGQRRPIGGGQIGKNSHTRLTSFRPLSPGARWAVPGTLGAAVQPARPVAFSTGAVQTLRLHQPLAYPHLCGPTPVHPVPPHCPWGSPAGIQTPVTPSGQRRTLLLSMVMMGCGAVIHHTGLCQLPLMGVGGSEQRPLSAQQLIIISWLMMNSDLQSR